MDNFDIAEYIEYTCLKPEASEKDIKNLCDNAKKYNYYGVCVNPRYVEFAKKQLKNSDCKVVTVVGFPLGENTSEIKSLEAMLAVNNGADEIDVVISISAVKNGDYEYVYDEFLLLVEDCKKPVKAIIETAKLTPDEIVEVCHVLVKAGVKFIKTSTGFAERGASLEDIKLIKSAVMNKVGIKASGGIKSYEFARSLIDLGATRIGTSSILEGN